MMSTTKKRKHMLEIGIHAFMILKTVRKNVNV